MTPSVEVEPGGGFKLHLHTAHSASDAFVPWLESLAQKSALDGACRQNICTENCAPVAVWGVSHRRYWGHGSSALLKGNNAATVHSEGSHDPSASAGQFQRGSSRTVFGGICVRYILLLEVVENNSKGPTDIMPLGLLLRLSEDQGVIFSSVQLSHAERISPFHLAKLYFTQVHVN